MRVGYFLSCEEFTPAELIEQATMAERAGFDSLWISDHYHPWTDAQGQSAFVWSMIGALAQVTTLPITTAVTCPTVRIHPAVIAQAAATSAVLTQGRFTLGVGTGEALNEHILGDAWPAFDVRRSMLIEAVEVMRTLWAGGFVEHTGEHYRVENARIYTLPEQPVPVYVSGFGPKAARMAGEVGDGFICTKPEPDLIQAFRDGGGGAKVAQGGYKVCWGTDEDAARKKVFATWANEQLPGELAQVLPSPRHFEQAATLVTEEMVGDAVTCGPDMDRHVAQLQSYVDAGYDEVYINQIGPDQRGFFDAYARDVLPRFH